MLKLDLDKFWMLPRCTRTLANDKNEFCAVGAFNEATNSDQGFAQLGELIGSLTLWEIVHMNDTGLDTTGWNKRLWIGKRLGKGKDAKFFRRASWPNPEKAKRMLLEAVAGKVEIVSKELSLDSLPSFSEELESAK